MCCGIMRMPLRPGMVDIDYLKEYFGLLAGAVYRKVENWDLNPRSCTVAVLM